MAASIAAPEQVCSLYTFTLVRTDGTAERYGSAIYARFLEWEKAGVFEALCKSGLAEHDEFEGIAWRWQSIDGAMMKAPLAQQSVSSNPTDRGKNESKRHLLVDGRGLPLPLIVSAANRHDVSPL
jgi:putative transposase